MIEAHSCMHRRRAAIIATSVSASSIGSTTVAKRPKYCLASSFSESLFIFANCSMNVRFLGGIRQSSGGGIHEIPTTVADKRPSLAFFENGTGAFSSRIFVSAPSTPAYSVKRVPVKVAAWKFHGNNLSISSAVRAAGRCSSTWRSHVYGSTPFALAVSTSE